MIQFKNIGKVLSTAHQLFRDLDKKQITTAASRAINHTINKARTASARAIGKNYNLTYGGARKEIIPKKSFPATLTGRLDTKGSHLPLISFKTTRPYSKGMSVNLKRDRKHIRGAFLMTVGKHVGIFARGGYENNTFAFRHRRIRQKGHDLPITELTTFSLPQAFMNEQVMDTVVKELDKSFEARFFHELDRMMKPRTK